MQDRFKFRAWDTQDKEYEYDAQNISMYDLYEDSITLFRYIERDEPNIILEQCTGLKDKNGKLIYEGDILHLVSETVKVEYVVKWDEHNAQLFLDVLNDWGRTDFDIADLKDLEIIGNIHENPELLEELK